MKKYKVYSNELKLDVVNEYLVTKKLKIHEIQTKYELSTPVLIYTWVKEYQEKGKQAFTKNSTPQTSHRIDKEDIENKLLKQENEKLRKELLKEKVENEFLKEWQACDKRLITINTKSNCKCLKNKCFQIIEKYKLKGCNIKEVLTFLPVSKIGYYKWVKKGKKGYKTKIDANLLEELNKIAIINSQEKTINITSLEKVRLQLKKNNPELKCSKISIKSVLETNSIKLLIKPKRQRRTVTSDPKFDARDLLKRNFKSNIYLEKVGLDGTWFKGLIINNQKTKLLVELATDMSSNSIVGWKVNQSENALTVLDVVNQVLNVNIKENKMFATIIQSDLGSGNTSEIVVNNFKTSMNLIHSLSLSGFKGNQVSECLNRWIKRDFKIMFGNKFDSVQHFTQSLKTFINWWNNDRMILRLKMSPNQFIQIWRQESKLI